MQNNSIDYNEEHWENFSNSFLHQNGTIDLRSNGGSPIPKLVLEKLVAGYSDIQALPTVNNAKFEIGEKEALRVAIAKQINCQPNEVAMMRNATEALNNAIMGFPFKKGDEVIASVHEYDSMLGSLYQRQLKDGITVKQIDIPYKPASKEAMLQLWENSITANTKMFLISHMVWISGQIYPVKEICDLARRHNIKTVIDAAQTFSHINIDVQEMGCDYLGTSMHKWCAAPLGTGFLFVKKENISATYPLLGGYKYLPDDDRIEKFENFGTISPVFKPALISMAIWDAIGLAAKTKRMQELKMYWTAQLGNHPAIEIVSNTNENDTCGLCYFSLKNTSATMIKEVLWQKHHINVQAIENYTNDYVNYKNVNAVGIATPVFITKKQLDVFVAAVATLV